MGRPTVRVPGETRAYPARPTILQGQGTRLEDIFTIRPLSLHGSSVDRVPGEVRA